MRPVILKEEIDSQMTMLKMKLIEGLKPLMVKSMKMFNSQTAWIENRDLDTRMINRLFHGRDVDKVTVDSLIKVAFKLDLSIEFNIRGDIEELTYMDIDALFADERLRRGKNNG